MAEVHALLFVTGEALTADDLMTELGISRGNASMTIRTLEEWGIVRRTAEEATRRDLFTAEQDVWHLFAAVIRVRKAREIDPLTAVLTRCRAQTSGGLPGCWCRRRWPGSTLPLGGGGSGVGPSPMLIEGIFTKG
jgi:DNA-binding transcriptional regulator GbsR (MarR family)